MVSKSLRHSFQDWLSKQKESPSLEETFLAGYREALNNPDQEEMTKLLRAFILADSSNKAEATGRLEAAIQRLCARVNNEKNS